MRLLFSTTRKYLTPPLALTAARDRLTERKLELDKLNWIMVHTESGHYHVGIIPRPDTDDHLLADHGLCIIK